MEHVYGVLTYCSSFIYSVNEELPEDLKQSEIVERIEDVSKPVLEKSQEEEVKSLDKKKLKRIKKKNKRRKKRKVLQDIKEDKVEYAQNNSK
jgi:hypothetical protein